MDEHHDNAGMSGRTTVLLTACGNKARLSALVLGLLAELFSGAAAAHFKTGLDYLEHLRADRIPQDRPTRSPWYARRLLELLSPGFARFGIRNARADLGSDPGVFGQWSSISSWPVVAVHAALLPDGRVLAYDSIGPNATETYTTHDHTRVTVWDPVDDTHTDVSNDTGYNLFCSGLAHLPDGREFLAGGNLSNLLQGIDATHYFDPTTSSWSMGPTMVQGGRWYPSVTPLANGEMLITGGGPVVPEVLQSDGSLRSLDNDPPSLPLYPWLTVTPNGTVAYLGPDQTFRSLDPSGTGIWDTYGQRDSLDRSYGSHAMYDIGKVLVAGGNVSSDQAVIVDLNGSVPASTATSPMHYGRRQHNLTVLADGSVLVTGGNSSGETLVDVNHGVYHAERWVPETGQWSTLAPMVKTRQYHSVALLLPDGRVLSAGGGVCNVCTTQSYLNEDAEIFSPPYLFLHDGSQALAPRPLIASAPDAIAPAQAFSVTTPSASTIAKVALVRLSSVTHSVNFEQRYVPLSFRRGSNSLRVAAPANFNLAPPGHYMLFLVDNEGVPSTAKIMHVAAGVSQPNDAPVMVNPGPRSDFLGLQATLSIAASDPESGELSFAAAQLPPGLTINAATGVISGTLLALGDFEVTVSATDDFGATSSTTFRWSIGPSPIPEPPQLKSPGNRADPADLPLTLQLQATDPNMDPVTFGASGLPPGLNLDTATGILSGTPTVPGSYTVKLHATDNRDGTDLVTFMWLIGSAGEITLDSSSGVAFEYYEGTWAKIPNFANLGPIRSGIAKTLTLVNRRRDYRYAFRYQSYLRLPSAGSYTFIIDSDASSRLWIDGQAVVNNDGQHALRIRTGSIDLPAGDHLLTVEMATLQSAKRFRVGIAGAGMTFKALPANLLFQPGPGFTYEYFEGNWASFPKFDRLSPKRRGYVRLPSLAPRLRARNFGMRLRGRFSVVRSGLYTFSLQTDGNSRLYLDKRLIVATDELTSGTQRQGTAYLPAGESVLTLDYQHRNGVPLLNMAFRGPSISRRALGLSVVPAD